MDLVEQLNHIFNPRAIIVVGTSNNPSKTGFMRAKKPAGSRV